MIRLKVSNATKKFLKWLFPTAFTVAGVANFSPAVALSGEIGSTATSFLLAHGITQPILGAALLASSFAMVAHHVEKMKPTTKTVSDPKVEKTLKQIQAMEKKYGTDFMKKLDSVASVLSQQSKKN